MKRGLARPRSRCTPLPWRSAGPCARGRAPREVLGVTARGRRDRPSGRASVRLSAPRAGCTAVCGAGGSGVIRWRPRGTSPPDESSRPRNGRTAGADPERIGARDARTWSWPVDPPAATRLEILPAVAPVARRALSLLFLGIDDIDHHTVRCAFGEDGRTAPVEVAHGVRWPGHVLARVCLRRSKARHHPRAEHGQQKPSDGCAREATRSGWRMAMHGLVETNRVRVCWHALRRSRGPDGQSCGPSRSGHQGSGQHNSR